MRTRIGMLTLALAAILGGLAKAEAHAAPITSHALYKVRVLAGTVHYPPCVKLRATREGQMWFADMLSDTYDEGKRRTATQQVRYVREGCREMTR